MKDIHPLYAYLLNRLVDLDQRELMPNRDLRFQELANYIMDGSESDTDVIEIDLDELDI